MNNPEHLITRETKRPIGQRIRNIYKGMMQAAFAPRKSAELEDLAEHENDKIDESQFYIEQAIIQIDRNAISKLLGHKADDLPLDLTILTEEDTIRKLKTTRTTVDEIGERKLAI